MAPRKRKGASKRRMKRRNVSRNKRRVSTSRTKSRRMKRAKRRVSRKTQRGGKDNNYEYVGFFYTPTKISYDGHPILVTYVKIGRTNNSITNDKGYFYAKNTEFLNKYIKTDVTIINNIKTIINSNIYNNKFNIAENFKNHFLDNPTMSITAWGESESAKNENSKLEYFAIEKIQINDENKQMLQKIFTTKNYNN